MRALQLGEITHIQYDSSGIMEHKSRMDSLHLRLIEAGHPLLEPLYLSFFVNTLPEEFDAISNTIDWDNDTVEELVSNFHQVEIRKGLCTTTEGSAFVVATKKQQQKPGSTSASTSQGASQGTLQGAKGSMLKKSSGCSGKCYNCGVQGHYVNKGRD
jgi:hypothetical protein